jgi:hypothetical protein
MTIYPRLSLAAKSSDTKVFRAIVLVCDDHARLLAEKMRGLVVPASPQQPEPN